MADAPALPTMADLEAAAVRLQGIARRTPLLEAEALNEQLDGRVLFKAECLQRTGAFKFRGAYNTLAQIETEAVVAYSSGNHALGVAAAAGLLGRRATIVMPADAPAIKVEGTRAFGAKVRLYDRWRESREEIGAEIAARTGAALIKPYDDPRIIAGQGTVGIEIAEQARSIGAAPDVALVPCGGGGLLAGCALALRATFPGIEVLAVEPEGFDDTARSLASGTRQTNPEGGRSICDALILPTPGELTFALNREQVAAGLAVGDEDVLHAMAAAFRELKLVVEPGGAVGLAALLAGRCELRGRTAVVVLSGGNVDPVLYTRALAAGD